MQEQCKLSFSLAPSTGVVVDLNPRQISRIRRVILPLNARMQWMPFRPSLSLSLSEESPLMGFFFLKDEQAEADACREQQQREAGRARIRMKARHDVLNNSAPVTYIQGTRRQPCIQLQDTDRGKEPFF